jgi:predicted membrane-bound spermidine synthase
MKQRSMLPLLILASFIEGGSLMAFEILSVKIYTPFLGASLYVWTSILAVTLLGLAAGYRTGGYFAGKDSKKILIYSFFLSGALVMLSTYTVKAFSPLFLNAGIRIASLTAGLLVLFFPVFFMGLISPLIVNYLNRMYKNLAKSTGMVYGTGTSGGILFVLVTVYILIPELGVRNTSFLLGTLLVAVGAFLKFQKMPLADEKI